MVHMYVYRRKLYSFNILADLTLVTNFELIAFIYRYAFFFFN